MGKYIDLHLHSTHSDGERTVEEIIDSAIEEDMAVIAITDHNSFALSTPINKQGLQVLPGCEFSTSCNLFGRKVELHIVGIFTDCVDKNLESVLASVDKDLYMKAVITKLNTLGVDVSWEELLAETHTCKKIGRLQLADLLVKRGYAKDRDEAMDKWIGNFSPYYLNPADYVSFMGMEECVKLIRKYKGFPILAHPYHYKYTEEEIALLVKHFCEIADGPMGIEVYYRDYTEDRIAYLTKLAKKYSLYPSASSDAHKKTDPFVHGDYVLYENMKNAMEEWLGE